MTDSTVFTQRLVAGLYADGLVNNCGFTPAEARAHVAESPEHIADVAALMAAGRPFDDACHRASAGQRGVDW